MLKRSFILSALIFLSRFVLGGVPSDERDILNDLGITKQEAVDVGLWVRIEQAIKTRDSFKERYAVTNRCINSAGFVLHETYDCTRALAKWAEEYYENILPALRKEYGDLKIEQARYQSQKALQWQQLVAEKKKVDQLQIALEDIQKQLKEQSLQMDKLIAGNSPFIRFLVLMDSTVTTERDFRARVEAAKQLLESDLVNEQQKVLLLSNKIKDLKSKAEMIVVENIELRSQLNAELEAIQILLKERMLAMM